MRFVLYSEKTIAQCLTAINARMHVKGTTTRPTLDGWVEKSGTFSINVTSNVVGKFTRRTRLTAKVERLNGMTVIQGSVSSGASREAQIVIFIALVLVAVSIMGSGNVLFGLLLIPFAAYLYVPLHGDFINSQILLDEVEKTLKAKAKPPKKAVGEVKAKTGEPKPIKIATKAVPKAAKPKTATATAPRAPRAASTSPVPKPKPAPASKFPTESEFPVAPESEFPPMGGEEGFS